MTITREPFCWREAVKLTLPKEHGSWSLALEPVAFGLLVAPSAAGAALTLAAVSGFFLRRPLKLAITGKRDPRQPLAAVCVAALALAGLSGLVLAARLGAAGGLWPLLPAAFAGLIFAWCDGHNGAREEAAEVAGTVAFGILPAAYGALAGWGMAVSLALSAIILTRCVPTVLLVRTCLRMKKGRTYSIGPALLTASLGSIAAVWLTTLGLMPWTAAAFALLLMARAYWLLFWRPRLTAKTTGIFEAILGVLMVLVLAITWRSVMG